MPENDDHLPLLKSPRSEEQRAASRANGKRSRGPITPAGKARSAANALDHGLYARSALLAKAVLLPGESRARFNDLLAQFRLQFGPANYIEHIFVEQMFVSQWRLMRTWSLERASICHAARDVTPDSDCPTRDAVAVLANPAPLLAFNYLEMRYERQVSRSLDKFYKLRDRNRAAENERNEPGNLNETDDLPK